MTPAFEAATYFLQMLVYKGIGYKWSFGVSGGKQQNTISRLEDRNIQVTYKRKEQDKSLPTIYFL
jgi:hypothetical protein